MNASKVIAGVAGMALVGLSHAEPPLQLADRGIRLEPLAVAPAWIEDGTIKFGDWVAFTGADGRGVKAEFYVFDSFGGFAPEGTGYVYWNHANGGRGGGLMRWPWDTECNLETARWYFGPSHVAPLMVEDIQSLACGASGGGPIDGIDCAWYWGGGTCVISFFTSDEPAGCDDGDPLSHEYMGGAAVDFGSIPPGGFYFANVDGLYSQLGIIVPLPAPGGSYLETFTDSSGDLNTLAGTQSMLWGTGDAHAEPFRAGTQNQWGWSYSDGTLECGDFMYSVCPDPLGSAVGFLQLRCPSDVNWDGFVNADDYDLFAENFDVANPCADLNGDGFVNGNDYDAFATWFDEGC
ncbi:MAG: hypothetical protein JNL50_07500 [Phycisphaerae bacterium]|nr:hypothetical protein [Phycisphaerae bacterium]